MRKQFQFDIVKRDILYYHFRKSKNVIICYIIFGVWGMILLKSIKIIKKYGLIWK